MKAQPAKISRLKAEKKLKPGKLKGPLSLGIESPNKNGAFGRPGIEPRWTHGDKDGVGTSYAASSRIWFTLWNGVITEVYYPTVDHPQIRDLQFLITDRKSFFYEERRDLKSTCERLSDHALAIALRTSSQWSLHCRQGNHYDPHLACILRHVQLAGDDAFISKLRLYTLCAPHLQVGGWGNNGYVVEASGRKILMARKKGIWLALGGTVPFSRVSCGYVGRSDGWTDLASNFKWIGSSIMPLTGTLH